MIATLAEIKTLLGITDTSKDTLITMLLPIVENEIHNQCNYHFIKNDETVNVETANITFDESTKKITDTGNGFEDFKSDMTIKIFGSLYNNGIFQIDEVAEDYSYITVNETVVTEDSGNSIKIYRVLYPDELKLIQSSMINYKITKGKPGISSETFSKYSVSYDTASTFNYPASIIRALSKFTRVYKKEY